MAEFTDVEKQLMVKITQSRLRDSLAQIRNAAEDIWAGDDALRIIRDYTDHGIHHSERLAIYAAQLLEVNDGRSLSDEEAYLLLADIYLHDIGMQCDVVKYPDIKAKAEAMGAKFDVEFTAQTASGYTIDEQKAIRKNHHLLTGAWIDYARRTGDTSLGPAIRTTPDKLVGDLIDVCKYHAKLPIAECPITFTLDDRGRKQLVAALVRFADELDVDGHRVSAGVVKNFRLDPRNAVYWWLHQLTSVNINGNVITLITRLHPDDEQRYGPIIREAFIEQFQTKNRPVLTVLRQNNIPVAIADSGVVPYEYADPLPDEVMQALELMQEKGSALDELADEVKTWLEAVGYEVSDLTEEGRTQDMVATMRRGLMRQQVLVRCFEGEITQTDAEDLATESSPQKWAISEMRVAPSAREYAETQPAVQVFNLADFMRMIWGPYFDYLSALVEESDIPRYYVDLGCHKKKTDEEGREAARDTYPVIDAYIDDWLSERGKLHVSILGEFGTGKTWFCRHYAYRQLQRYLDDPIKERFPLLITLRTFTKATTAQQLINNALLEQYKLPFVGSAFDIFQEMNRQGKLLLILDGFDEMARKVEYQTVVDTFWDLAEMVVEGSKVLLTSRTEYFRWAKESERVLGGEELGRKMTAIKPPEFEVLYLEPFTDEQIEEVIVKRVDSENGPAIARRILDNPNLAELARKPVLIELLMAALPGIEVREDINEAQIYLYATNELLLRNITAERTFTTTADKLFFLCELAWEMIRSGELRIHYKDIPERIQALFGDRIKDKPELDHWDYDLRNQTLLQRNAAGYYEFAHKSLAEYFVAYKFATELDCLASEFTQTYCEVGGRPCKLPYARKDVSALSKTVGDLSFSDARMQAVQGLLAGMVGDVDRLWAVIDETKGKTYEDVGYVGGNAATILNQMDQSFNGRKLAQTVLVGADLIDGDLANVDLRGALVREASFVRALMWNTDLTYSDLGNIPNSYIDSDTFLSLDISSNGDLIAGGCIDASIQVWHSHTATLLLAVKGHRMSVQSVRFMPNGSQLVSGGGNGKVTVWDIETGESISVKIETEYVRTVDCSPDGQLIAAAGSSGTIHILNAQTLERVALLKSYQEVKSVSFSPDSRLLASGGADTIVTVWDLKSGEIVESFQGHSRDVFSVCFFPDGRRIVSGGAYSDDSIRVWSLTAKTEVLSVSREDDDVGMGLYDVRCSPDGSIFAGRRSGTEIGMWDSTTGELITCLQGHKGNVYSLVFSPDGRCLISGAEDATARIWDINRDSSSFGKSLHIMKQRRNMEGLRIDGAKGLEQEVEWLGIQQPKKGTLRQFLLERGATMETHTLEILEAMTKKQLQKIATLWGLKKSGRKAEIIDRIFEAQSEYR
ncbi:MAG: NACHT domain-containing protein [Chloroflexi bacterium]|nr:NACHT domain-containing protein [Chloroflexota bacterium]